MLHNVALVRSTYETKMHSASHFLDNKKKQSPATNCRRPATTEQARAHVGAIGRCRNGRFINIIVSCWWRQFLPRNHKKGHTARGIVGVELYGDGTNRHWEPSFKPSLQRGIHWNVLTWRNPDCSCEQSCCSTTTMIMTRPKYKRPF